MRCVSQPRSKHAQAGTQARLASTQRQVLQARLEQRQGRKEVEEEEAAEEEEAEEEAGAPPAIWRRRATLSSIARCWSSAARCFSTHGIITCTAWCRISSRRWRGSVVGEAGRSGLAGGEEEAEEEAEEEEEEATEAGGKGKLSGGTGGKGANCRFGGWWRKASPR